MWCWHWLRSIVLSVLTAAVFNAAFAAEFEVTVVEIGDSNTNGYRPDLTYGGQPLDPRLRAMHNGVEFSEWSDDATPSPAKVPYLFQLIFDAFDAAHPPPEDPGGESGSTGDTGAGATGDTGEPPEEPDTLAATYIRRGKNGSLTTWPGGLGPSTLGNQWTQLKADTVALGVVPDIAVITFGANDSRKTTPPEDGEALANAYEGNVDRLIDEMNAEWGVYDVVTETWDLPLILLVREDTSIAGATNLYVWLDTVIYPAQDDLATAHWNVFVIDGQGLSRWDAIHFDQEGQAGLAQISYDLVHYLGMWPWQ